MKIALIALAAAVASAAQSKISNALNRAFEVESSGQVDVLVKFDTDINALNAAADASPDNRNEAVFQFLSKATADSETKLRAVVGDSAKLEPLWIAQSFLVRLNKETVLKVADLPQVTYLDVNGKVTLPKVLERESTTEAAAGVEWGIQAVGAPSIWKYFKGKGVVVGSIDTGALASHEAIKATWRSDKGWFDPYDKKPTPYDSQGHGSHTIGTMVGVNGIGVAPEAQWIACMGLNGNSGSFENLLKCAEFILCPTNPDGTDRDCKKGADVVNNSWGAGGDYDPFYEAAIAAWKAANIVPIFANGNSGPVCASTLLPGGYKSVISVGAIGSPKNDPTALAFFSSKGSISVTDPSNGQTVTIIKPDISAPGYWVRSVGIKSDSSYVENAGTSMAAPHVAGVVALMKSANKTINYDQVYNYLTKTTEQKVLNTTEPAIWDTPLGPAPGGFNCGGVKDTTWPNNRFGHGRVDVGTILRDGFLHDTRRDTC